MRSHDTAGYSKSDDLYYAPKELVNKDSFVRFAAEKCDFTKEIVVTGGGVACVYAGEKQIRDGAAEKRKKP